MKSLFYKTLAKTPILHLTPFSLLLSSKFSSNLKFPSGFDEVEEDEMVKVEEREKIYPRPRNIPFQSKVANFVKLIGTVQMPVQFVTTADGKSWAGTILSQGKSPYPMPLSWIPIIFEGDLAHTAATHVKLSHNVYVAGKLSSDPVPINLTNGRVDMQVIVHDLHFVRGYRNTKNFNTCKATNTRH